VREIPDLLGFVEIVPGLLRYLDEGLRRGGGYTSQSDIGACGDNGDDLARFAIVTS
jgi:hypothetical protein